MTGGLFTPISAGMNGQTTLERAFDLARSGEYATVDEIRSRLKAERHDQVEAHLAGPSIKRQLAKVCVESRRTPA